jgi:hypothetical protein
MVRLWKATNERLKPSGEMALLTMGSVLVTVAAKPRSANARVTEVTKKKDIGFACKPKVKPMRSSGGR